MATSIRVSPFQTEDIADFSFKRVKDKKMSYLS